MASAGKKDCEQSSDPIVCITHSEKVNRGNNHQKQALLTDHVTATAYLEACYGFLHHLTSHIPEERMWGKLKKKNNSK